MKWLIKQKTNDFLINFDYIDSGRFGPCWKNSSRELQKVKSLYFDKSLTIFLFGIFSPSWKIVACAKKIEFQDPHTDTNQSTNTLNEQFKPKVMEKHEFEYREITKTIIINPFWTIRILDFPFYQSTSSTPLSWTLEINISHQGVQNASQISYVICQSKRLVTLNWNIKKSQK